VSFSKGKAKVIPKPEFFLSNCERLVNNEHGVKHDATKYGNGG
jgi:hypothetical protein